MFVELTDMAVNMEVMSEAQSDTTNKVLDMTIEELDLSVRSYNCLKEQVSKLFKILPLNLKMI